MPNYLSYVNNKLYVWEAMLMMWLPQFLARFGLGIFWADTFLILNGWLEYNHNLVTGVIVFWCVCQELRKTTYFTLITLAGLIEYLRIVTIYRNTKYALYLFQENIDYPNWNSAFDMYSYHEITQNIHQNIDQCQSTT